MVRQKDFANVKLDNKTVSCIDTQTTSSRSCCRVSFCSHFSLEFDIKIKNREMSAYTMCIWIQSLSVSFFLLLGRRGRGRGRRWRLFNWPLSTFFYSLENLCVKLSHVRFIIHCSKTDMPTEMWIYCSDTFFWFLEGESEKGGNDDTEEEDNFWPKLSSDEILKLTMTFRFGPNEHLNKCWAYRNKLKLVQVKARNNCSQDFINFPKNHRNENRFSPVKWSFVEKIETQPKMCLTSKQNSECDVTYILG